MRVNFQTEDCTFTAQIQRQKYNSQKGMNIKMKLINIGYGNMVSANRIITIVSPESALSLIHI